MIISSNSYRLLQFSIFMSLMASSVVLGCGQLPQGQTSSIKFTVNGSTLPVEMAYSEVLTVQSLVPGISRSMQEAKTLVERQIKDAVEDVLEQQGRSAFLPDALISQILQQLRIDIIYDPLQCQSASDTANQPANFDAKKPEGCFIVTNFVSVLCEKAQCMLPMMNLKRVPLNFMSISGSLSTSNIIMANWSLQMWQNVLNRVHRRLSSSSSLLGSFFSTATVTISR